MRSVKKFGVSLAVLTAALCAAGFAACEKEHSHVWSGNVSYEWSEDYSSCTAKRVCIDDSSHVESETVQSVKAIEQEASCEKEELSSYTVTFENSAFEKKVKEHVKTGEALGHSYGKAVYELNGDHSECHAKRECEREGCEAFEEETKAVAENIISAADCVNKGSKNYSVSFENSAFNGEDGKWVSGEFEIAALGHDWGAASYAWNSDNTKCSAERLCEREGCDGKEEETANAENGAISQERSCTQPEKRGVVAKFENPAFEQQSKKEVETAPALGHAWSKASYAWNSDNTKCVAEHHCERDGCSESEREERVSSSEVLAALSCTVDGKIKYSVSFSANWAENQSKEVTTPALGHEWGEVVYELNDDKSACHAERHCQREGCKGKPEEETKEVTEHIISAANCDNKGSKYYSVSFENPAFNGEDGKWVSGEFEIAALGHEWGDVSYNWSEDHSKCVAKRICKREGCGFDESDEGVVSSVKAEADCENAGSITYSAKFSKEWAEDQTAVTDIPALGHDWEVVYEWAEDYSACKASKVCKRNAAHVENVVVGTVSSENVAATCEDPAKTVYTATFEGSDYEDAVKEVITGEALGHIWNVLSSVAEDKSSAVRSCSRSGCGKTETVSIDGDLSEKVGSSENTLEAAQLIEPGKNYYMNSSEKTTNDNNYVQFKIPENGGKVVVEICRDSSIKAVISPVYYWAKDAKSGELMVGSASSPIKVTEKFADVYSLQYSGSSRYRICYHMEFNFSSTYGGGAITISVYSPSINHLISISEFEENEPPKEYSKLQYNPEQANEVKVNPDIENDSLNSDYYYEFIAEKAGTYGMKLGGGVVGVYSVGADGKVDLENPFLEGEFESLNFVATAGQKFIWVFAGIEGRESFTVLIGDELIAEIKLDGERLALNIPGLQTGEVKEVLIGADVPEKEYKLRFDNFATLGKANITIKLNGEQVFWGYPSVADETLKLTLKTGDVLTFVGPQGNGGNLELWLEEIAESGEESGSESGSAAESENAA